MWLPRKLYESLPVLYVLIGAMFLAGTLYVGLYHWKMLGYLAVGALCVALGFVVIAIRRKARADAESRSSRSSELFV
ncbi:MAG: hypothetical protein QNJ05_07155 [Woeseiaceae bacterium]|nr:hypothetical protein [Woeseiaceae bacterium]